MGLNANVIPNVWSWTCQSGNGGGNPASCSAAYQANNVGACGTDNGETLPTLSASDPNLCGTGNTVVNFSGSGPWTWNCNNTGGNSPQCTASMSDGSCSGAQLNLLWSNNVNDPHCPGGICTCSGAAFYTGPPPSNTIPNGKGGLALYNTSCGACGLPNGAATVTCVNGVIQPNPVTGSCSSCYGQMGCPP